MKTFIRIKNNFISIIFILFIPFLVIFINDNLLATKQGIKLWANNVLPSLFPFLVAFELLSYTNIVNYLSRKFNFIMRPLFNLPGLSIFAFILGIISGYPVGAKVVCNLYNNHQCSKDEAERMLPLCNNSSPLFIIATVGISMFGSSKIGFLLLFIHILSSIIIGFLLGTYSKITTSNMNYNKTLYYTRNPIIRISDLGQILQKSIISSIKSVLIIGGFITIFSVIISILKCTKLLLPISIILSKILNSRIDLIESFCYGIIEFTNGLKLLTSINLKNINIILSMASALLGFGGLSVLLQVLGIISSSKLSIKKYLVGKILQGILAGFLTYILFMCSIFNLNI